MLTGLLVVVFVELSNEFLKDRTHGVVVHCRVFDRAVAVEDGIGAEVHLGIKKFFDQRSDGVSLRKGGDLVTEFEIFNDVLNIV